MKSPRLYMLGAILAVLAFRVGCTAAFAGTALSGDQILARAAVAPGLTSYSVPIHFDVHMHRPLSITTSVEGIMYYKAPAQAALVITKIPSIIGKFFKGSYSLDMIPQTWPSKYTVTSVEQTEIDGASTYMLESVPKSDSSVDRVVFGVMQADYAPVSVAWHYRDGSSINVSMQNQHLSGYTLAQTESITVNMPQFGLNATANYGSYALNASVPDSVFVTQ
ncbi:MAG TPA: outer membrane lipoprotein-sorting protein [Candidatus Binatia bacterium]|nr:outer membrane lipoprotein-sorting protein [Candidatus Binatia bacterium]